MKRTIAQVVDEMKKLIDSTDGVTLAEMVGILEILKSDLIHNARESE